MNYRDAPGYIVRVGEERRLSSPKKGLIAEEIRCDKRLRPNEGKKIAGENPICVAWKNN